MPQIIITQAALEGMEACRQLLMVKSPLAAKRAAQSIQHQFTLLENEPETGRSLDDFPMLRELIIHFGNSGYVALYRLDITADRIYILAFRHQKEAGY